MGTGSRDGRRKGLILLAAAVLALALPACGGGDGDEDEIRATIEEARQAAIDGDAASFCGYLSDAVIADLKENGDINSVVPTCAKLVAANEGGVKEIASQKLTISDVKVSGETATATVKLAGQGERRFVTLGVPVTIEVTPEGGQWKLAALP